MPDEKSAQSDTATEVAERIAAQVAKTSGKATVTDESATEDSAPEAELDAEVADVLEGGDESETSESEGESSTPIKSDETAEEADEVGELLKRIEPKDNVQKRIDQLTARIKQLESENTQIKAKDQTKAEPEYTDAQLENALSDALEKGDSKLAFEIMKYMRDQVKNDLVKQYQTDIKNRSELQNRVNQEWQKVCNDYSQIWEDDGKELYPGAQKDLNVKDESSLVYKVAMALFNQKDEDGAFTYHQPGGQRMAVADALALILKKKKLVGKEKKLERALAKEKRKKSLGSGSAAETETPAKVRSNKEDLSDYLGSRKKFLNERK